VCSSEGKKESRDQSERESQEKKGYGREGKEEENVRVSSTTLG